MGQVLLVFHEQLVAMQQPFIQTLKMNFNKTIFFYILDKLNIYFYK